LELESLTYMSRARVAIALAELTQSSAIRNRSEGITGVLVTAGDLFFQTIEGPPPAIEALLDRLRRDDRHGDLVILHRKAVAVRQYPSWNMEAVNLADHGALAEPLRLLMVALGESHTILARYTQPAVLRMLQAGQDPSVVAPREIERVVLFADLASFSALCDSLPFAVVGQLVNDFFTLSTQEVIAAGGEVAKLIGDSVMAWMPPGGETAAIQAALRIQERLAQVRARAAPGDPHSLLRSGVGIASGVVIEGNMGGALKLDYTLMGPAVNEAARLESLTRDMGRSVLCSKAVAQAAKWPMVSLGERQLRGFRKPSQVFTVESEWAAGPDRAAIEHSVQAYMRTWRPPTLG